MQVMDKYRKTVLTLIFELHIISLPKLNLAKEKLDEKERKLLKWCEFLVNPYNVDVEGYDKIMEAKEEIEKIRKDKRERWLAEQRQKYIWDMKATEKFGYEKGSNDKSKEIAKKMMDEGIDIETVIKVTGLTEEEINKKMYVNMT